MSSENSAGFSRWRQFFWPVYRSEMRVFLPLFLIYFLITFNYSLLRATKDSLVITAKSSGAEAIPFIKVWAILPAAILMTFLFTRLTNRYKTERVFYIMISLFLGFFALFALVLYPFQDSLHPNALADRLELSLPSGFRGLIAVFRNWTFTLFYVMAELWSTAIMTVLFWGFVNEITHVKAAKRFYFLLTLGANLSAIASGQMAGCLSNWGSRVTMLGTDAWGNSLMLLSGLICITGILVMAIFRWMTTKGMPGVSNYSSFEHKTTPSEFKMGLRKNFALLAKSRYLLCIAIIVLTYNIAINLTEVIWKDQLHRLCPDPNDYQAYMGKVLIGVGILSTVMGLFGGALLQRFNWTFTALIPPVTLLLTGVGFFSFLLFKDTSLAAVSIFLGSTPLAMGVFFGSLQNCISRASKYTLFDATKELAFIPLSKEAKLKGKAAIDGVGSRLGKSGGAVIFQFMLITIGTVSMTIPYVAGILFIVISGWIVAVRSLGKQFNELMKREPLNDDAPQEVIATEVQEELATTKV